MTREEWLTIIKKAITDIDGLEWEKGMNGLTTTIRLNRNEAVSLYELIENNDTKLEESPRPSKPRTIDPPAYIFDLESGVISKSTNTSTKSVDTSTKSVDTSTKSVDTSTKSVDTSTDRPRGHWIVIDEYSTCSVCDAEIDRYDLPYCPFCGAKMDVRSRR